MSEEEKEQTVREEDDQGNILVYPAWNKNSAPKDKENKWESSNLSLMAWHDLAITV